MMFHANQAGLESKSWWENVPDGNLAFMARIGVPETMYNARALKFAADYKAKTGKTGVESYALWGTSITLTAPRKIQVRTVKATSGGTSGLIRQLRWSSIKKKVSPHLV